MDNYLYNTVLIKEGDGWSAMCLEHDFVAQGDSQLEALRSLRRTMIAQQMLDESEGKEPFKDIGPPPYKIAHTAQPTSEPPSKPGKYKITMEVELFEVNESGDEGGSVTELYVYFGDWDCPIGELRGAIWQELTKKT